MRDPWSILWPQWLVIVTTALPFVAVVAGRRLSWREPLGQVGLVWGYQFGCGLAAAVALLVRRPTGVFVAGLASSLGFALLLAPPLLTWIGPRAKRWQGTVLAGTALWAAAAIAAVDVRRGINLAFKTPSMLALLVLAAAMLIVQGRRAGEATGGSAVPGWLAIGCGHALYFLTGTMQQPLLELVLPYGMDLVWDVAMASMLVLAGAMTTIAWGLWQARVPRAAGATAVAIPTPG